MPKKEKAKTKFPQTLYVTVDEDRDGPWFTTSKNGEHAEDGAIVGIYELKRTVRKTVTHEFEPHSD